MSHFNTDHCDVYLQMVEIYDSSRGLVKIGPCKWSPNLDVAFWLSRNDATILRVRRCWKEQESYNNHSSESQQGENFPDIALSFSPFSSTSPPPRWLSRLTLSITWSPPSSSSWSTLTATASSPEVSRSSTAGQQRGSGRGWTSPPLSLQLLTLP